MGSFLILCTTEPVSQEQEEVTVRRFDWQDDRGTYSENITLIPSADYVEVHEIHDPRAVANSARDSTQVQQRLPHLPSPAR